MTKTKIYVYKAPKKQKVLRINTPDDIPKFLHHSIIWDKQKKELHLHNAERYEIAPFGSIICYEKSKLTHSGWICGAIEKPSNLVEINGEFYAQPNIFQAILIPEKNDEQPEWIKSCNLTYNDDGTVTIKTQDNIMTGRIGIDFLLFCGIIENDTPEAKILVRGKKAYHKYVVCDESGNDICKLSEMFPV